MSAAAIETEAVVVRLVDYGEADRIVGLFTRSSGLVSAVARAARRSQRRFGGTLQTGHHLVVELVPGRHGLGRLESARIVDPHLGLTTDLERLTEAALVLKAIREHMPEGEPDESVFDALVEQLAAVSTSGAEPRRLVRFRLGLFDHLGVGPQLDRCVRCGKEAPLDRPGCFDARLGGLVCRSCGGSSFVLSAAALTLARQIRRGEPPDPTPEAATELGRALDALAAVHLARRGSDAEVR